jgi:ribokinase
MNEQQDTYTSRLPVPMCASFIPVLAMSIYPRFAREGEKSVKGIAVVGSSNTDMIITLGRIPKPGETIIGGNFTMAAGGKGANQAVAAARAGGRVSFVARVGNDPFGEQAIRGFAADGIDVRHVLKDESTPSGVALIFVGGEGENCIGVASGANARLSPDDIETARETIVSAGVLLVQLEIPIETVMAAVRMAPKDACVILNPAPARPLDDELLKRVTVLTPNETEAELLTGIKVEDETGAAMAAEALRRRGPEVVIITLGARGALVCDTFRTRLVAAVSVDAVDATAAGDVFNGALALALAEERPIDEAVRFANAAAALSVTRPGAQPSAPRRAEIEALMRGI